MAVSIRTANFVKISKPVTPEKFNMFRNRLEKVNRHLSRQAKRQLISCYRVYDHDLPEFHAGFEG